MEQTQEKNHAIDNARGWSQSVSELVAALECDFDRLEELRDERADLVAESESASGEGADAEAKARAALDAWDAENGDELRELESARTANGITFKDADEVREHIQESVLDVAVRSGWHAPGADAEPEDFAILLSTGGPALRIRGELDEHAEPFRAWLEYQDWGTPWTEFHGEDAASQDDLLTFAQCFYFGA